MTKVASWIMWFLVAINAALCVLNSWIALRGYNLPASCFAALFSATVVILLLIAIGEIKWEGPKQ